ncbi:Arylsulfatase (EC [Olavius sp. associated proteobacterium Delta 1]|nr:Arylsulfatase (EC [Olavius sp. associated proteobacterium Delta 1]
MQTVDDDTSDRAIAFIKEQHAAGKKDIKQDLLDGYSSKALGREYKIHLDGYDLTAHLKDPANVPSLRKEIFYFSDDGDLTALRYGDWKLIFMEQKTTGTFRVWMEPFVPLPERIAVFDNDGCLWAEKPMYVQVVFALGRVKALAPTHSQWKDKQPFKAALEGDFKTVAAGGEHALVELIMATSAGMTADAFARVVKDWLATAKHPRFNRPYTDLVYQPMLELLAHLRANGFKTYIVSGGGIEFMRPWTEKVSGRL